MPAVTLLCFAACFNLHNAASMPHLPGEGKLQTISQIPSPPSRTKKKIRFRPGTVALREIRNLQKSWNLLIPASCFIRAVKEVSNQLAPQITRWQAEALVALQE
uniref:Core Histone H2A/H2B/H3 domain-containing protein n=1 Tax=Cucumis melo TaxID=3656 RepID=A0A9I9E4R9_CUCME